VCAGERRCTKAVHWALVRTECASRISGSASILYRMGGQREGRGGNRCKPVTCHVVSAAGKDVVIKKRGTIQVKGKGEMLTYWIRSAQGDSDGSQVAASRRSCGPSRELPSSCAGVMPGSDVLRESGAAAMDIEISLESPIPIHGGQPPFRCSRAI